MSSNLRWNDQKNYHSNPRVVLRLQGHLAPLNYIIDETLLLNYIVRIAPLYKTFILLRSVSSPAHLVWLLGPLMPTQPDVLRRPVLCRYSQTRPSA